MSKPYWALLVGFALATAACGANADANLGVASLEDPEPANPEASRLTDIVDLELALLDFSVCMRAEGVDVGDPTVDANGNVLLGTPTDSNTISDHGALMDAYAVCRELVGGRTLGHGDADRTAVHDRLLEFAGCVRDNGYDVPDPDFSNSGGDLFPGLDQDDPDFLAAQVVCEDLLVDDGA